MKSLKLVMLCLAFMSMASTQSIAQELEINKFLEGSVNDAEKILGGYVSPLMKSLSSGLNQGWYNTAKPHKVAGFDLTFTVNAMMIPNSELLYKPSDLGLQEIELESSQDGESVPTVFGPAYAPRYRITQTGDVFDGPEGVNMKGEIGVNMVPVPMAHLGFGLPKGTDIKLRFVPKINMGEDADLNLFGVGVMHDVKQWIPGLKMSPIDLSGFVGFTKFKMNYNIDEPGTEDARGVFEMTGLTVQGVVSKKISVLTLYGAVGYNMAKSKLSMVGKYDINDDGDYADAREVNPLAMEFGSGGPRVTGGFRLKLAVITLHADYTLQKYSCLSFGFGINVR